MKLIKRKQQNSGADVRKYSDKQTSASGRTQTVFETILVNPKLLITYGKYEQLNQLFITSSAIRLRECQDGQLQRRQSDGLLRLTCDQYNGSISWGYLPPDAYLLDLDLGTCSSTACEMWGSMAFLPANSVSLHYVNGGSSYIEVTGEAVTEQYSGYTYSCATHHSSARCQVAIVSD
ncbi:hypothetical protein BaRGS_00023168 [Batillaria attramentaria]|uniref:Uncharacterized protein n=1 Tax=Batillaria attramentaria TaxID=370345 RepID=A0ABD0KER6_9CAEN